MRKNPVVPLDIEGFPWSKTKKKVAQWPEWKQKAARESLGYKKKQKQIEYIKDKDLEIDI